jgi:hypothetical protein
MHKTIILFLLNGCETWISIIEWYMRMVLWSIFGPKTVEVTGSWRKLRNEELRNLYPSPMRKSEVVSWMGCIMHMWEIKNAYRILF